MKVEYRNLPHASEKVSTVGIGAGGLHEATPQEIKDVSFPSYQRFLSEYSSSGSSCYSGRSCSPGQRRKKAQNDVSNWLRKSGITEVKI